MVTTQTVTTGPNVSTVRGDAQPSPSSDEARVARVHRSLDRILWQRLEGDRAVVHGVARRRPVRLVVTRATALSLARRGVPTAERCR